jgi:hypothetical protein
MRKITRRGLLGGAVVAAAGSAGYGRYAFGDEFEEHVASVIGLPLNHARDLTRQAQYRFGDLKYDRLASAFLFATTAPGRWVTPRSTRQRAVHAFLHACVPDSRGNLVLLGLTRGRPSAACGGLLPR